MKKLYRFYTLCLLLLLCVSLFCVQAFAVEDMWTAANRIIVDVYNKIAGISTVLAGLMSAVAVVGAKLSNNQHKVDQAWDWLRRIWIAWAVINGIGAFIAYVAPLFQGLDNDPELKSQDRIIWRGTEVTVLAGTALSGLYRMDLWPDPGMLGVFRVRAV